MKGRRDILSGLFAAAVVLASRIPFLSRSYGYDGDAWSVAHAAGRIASEGRYAWSRPPGYPLHEMTTALVWRFGPLASNTLSALASSMASLLFFAVMRRLGASRTDCVLGALALAMVPVVMINSTVTLDYVWALALSLAALYAAIRRQYAWCGAALGLAAGFRITSGLLILPLGILLGAAAGPGSRRRVLTGFCLLALGVGGACYLPPALRYGPGFLRFVDEPIGTALHARLVLYGATIGTWGLLGTAGLGLALAGILSGRGKRTMLSPGDRLPAGRLALAGGIAVLLYMGAFIRLPLEFAYLVPLVPFVILLVTLYAPAWCGRTCLLLVIASPFLGHVGMARDWTWRGPVLADHAMKREQLASMTEVYALVNGAETDEVVVETGPEIDRFQAMSGGSFRFEAGKDVTLERTLSQAERYAAAEAGRTVYVLMKEQHLYRGAFVIRPGPGGKASMSVRRFD